MPDPIRSTVHVVLFGLGLAAGACASSVECPAGAEGCACDDGGGCDEGLSCISEVCVAAPEASCGDGIVQPPEECDNGALNRDDGACKSNCTLAYCGDGLVGPGEACDDGNDSDLDTCNAMCRFPTCGNGVVEGAEACDDGNADDTDACTHLCLPAACGDGYVQAGEACDDGNTMDGDGCSAACEIEAVCGNGEVMPGEICFERGPLVVVDALPVGLGAGDFDGDGLPDLATASAALGTVTVLRGDGTGNFLPLPAIALGGAPPTSAAVGDIDGDTYADVVVATGGTQDTVVVLYGTGIPGADQPVEDPMVYDHTPPVSEVRALQVDLNSAALEVLVGHETGASLLRIPDANSRDAPNWSDADVGTMMAPTLDAVDVTGDGVPEVVAVDRATGDLHVVPYLPATKTLDGANAQVRNAGLTTATWIAGGEFGAGKPEDLLVGVWDQAGCDYPTDPDACDGENVSLLVGNPDYEADPAGEDPFDLAAPVEIPAGKAPVFVLPVDLDGDADLDLVVANRFSHTLSILVSDGQGSFTEGPTLETAGFEPVAVLAADLDGNDLVDLVSLDGYTNSITVFLANP